MLRRKESGVLGCGGRRDREAGDGPIFCEDQPGSILLPQKKRNKKMVGEAAEGTTFDFAKMPKVCAKMHKTFNQSTELGMGQPIPKLQQKCTTAVAAAAADNDDCDCNITYTQWYTAGKKEANGANRKKTGHPALG